MPTTNHVVLSQTKHGPTCTIDPINAFHRLHPTPQAIDVFLKFSANRQGSSPPKVTNLVSSNSIQLEKTAKSNHYAIIDHANGGKILGLLKHPQNSLVQVELYSGKGGFTAIVTSPSGLRYFALPGAKVKVGDTVLELEGQPITTNPAKTRQKVKKTKPQTHTPQAMILGAGLATRFEPVSGENSGYAKPAVPLVGEQSVIHLIATSLANHGFHHLFINTFFKPDTLKQGLKTCPQAQSNTLNYIDEIDAPSGSAGGLRKMLQHPERYHFDTNKALLVVQGDAVTDTNFSLLMKAHAQQKALVTIGCQYLANKNDVSKFGIIETDQSDVDGVSGRILSFMEKPQPHETSSQLANTGFYIFSPQAYPIILEVFEEMGEAGEKELDFAKHIFPRVLQKIQQQHANHPFWAQKVDGYWNDIGNPTQYLESVHDIFKRKTNHPLPENKKDFYDKGIVYWPGAKALAEQEGAKLKGNVIVVKPA